MTSYVGNRSNDPIIDLMLDTIEDRGYDPRVLDHAVGDWQESSGEEQFWQFILGRAIDDLERTLGHYGLTRPKTMYCPNHEEPCELPCKGCEENCP